MRVKEVADITGVSVRTLHHYDEIGLLTPAHITEAGYRQYSEVDLALLQQILFFRELDFPLKQIKEIIYSPNFNQAEALELHRSMLLEKRSKLDVMLETLDRTIRHMKGEIEMTNKEKFQGFDFSHNPYEQEARERWGSKAVDEANAKISSMTMEQQSSLSEKMNEIYTRLAALRNSAPESEEAQAGIKEWFDFLNSMGKYTPEAFKGLGQMYVDDERFTKNIDKFGEGLAAFMRDAMAVFADKQSQ
ncbi:MerR family transcriptional regulator [Paenibacillus alvei]|uniref:MerR family transcriptional regulator n=1 Tax=Paenibacillus alvei TaxID=44250 RepID=UPI0018CFAC63|nr:MerR family transcriptional regulator [Paenibacillus alvei]MBG9735273.1 MerR family transcriptional regulator [Paenibacillus alvei]MBG9743730.1 MerR family transcriptional regulator [Paenibacillus alvei]MCY9580160.1 MerR family transcriptional regulator [Paenibacillus alvei]MCY9584335.1 MerR family transcriptional regulator [Paenibacillus alvei]